MLVSRRLLLRAAPLAAALGPLAACSSGTASDPHSSAGPAPASLVLDTAAWSHDADNDVYYQLGLSYVTAPQDTAHETLGIFVPGAYLSAVDNKAAVRYLRYNAAGLPGDVERVFVFGHSGGGAQSAVMGASGDSALYTPYLEALGAATAGADGGPLSDAIAGAMCWCPITSLNEASAAFSDFVTFPNFGQALLTSFLSVLATIIGWVVTVPLVFLMSGYACLRIQGRDAARWAR